MSGRISARLGPSLGNKRKQSTDCGLAAAVMDRMASKMEAPGMTIRGFARLGAAALTAALLVGVIAAPAAAANPTRWVDNDAGGGGGPAACATAAYTSIQAAIDASGNWDHVNVCPGTYSEQLTLDVKGILVQSMPAHQAHIVPPPVMTSVGGAVAIVRLTAWAARFVGFNIDIEGGSVAPPIQTGIITCSHADIAVLALGQRSRVRHNNIVATGDSLNGPCGYDYGVVVGTHSVPGLIPPFQKLGVARIAHNDVREFKFGGILVEGEDYAARIDHNTLRTTHIPPPPCLVAECTFSVINGLFSSEFGVGAEDGAAALIENNTISSVEFSPGLYTLSWGIALNAPDAATLVRYNNISSVGTGLNTAGNVAIPAEAGVGAAEIAGNTISSTYYGMGINDNGHDIHDNTVGGNLFGVNLYGSWNHVHDNNLAGNQVLDCNDASTSNVWENNVAALDNPPGICVNPT